MKIKVEFECEIYPVEYTPWFTVNNELNYTNLDYIESLEVFDAETGEELL